MSTVVEMRECRICPCTDFGSVPACTIHVAHEVGALIICCPVDTFGLLGLLFPDCFLASVLGIVVIPASSCILANTASLNDVPSLSSRVFRNDSSSPRRMLLRLLDGQELAILPRRIRL